MDRRSLHNTLLNFFGETLWGLKVGVIAPATVLTVLLLEHGASKQMIGAIDAIGMCLALLPQSFGVYIFHQRKKRKVRLVVWHIVALQPFLIIMGILTLYAGKLGNSVYCWGLLVAYAFFSFNVGVMVASWVSFLAGIFRKEIRGMAMGLAFFGSFLANAGGALLAGWLIKKYPGSDTLGWLYIASGLAGMAIINCWLFIDDDVADEKIDPPPNFQQFLSRFKHSLREKNFRNFLVGRILATSGFCVLSFFTVYFKSSAGGSLSNGFIVQAMAVMTLATAVTSPLLGRLGDKSGHRLPILIGALGQVFTFLIILFVPGKAGCLIAFAIAGCCTSCSLVSHCNLILETCPHDCHTTHVSVANLVVGIPLGVTPLFAGWIAEHFGTRNLFVVCLIVSFGALAWLYFKVKDPRTISS